MNDSTKKRAETAISRTARLISLVSYLNTQGSASVAELAEYFDVSDEQILSDINLLWVTGTPGYMADDLIDFDAFALEQGIVSLTAARGLGAPLRLGTKESVALLASLNALHATTVEGTEEQRLIQGLIAKLSISLGENAKALDIRLTDEEVGPTLNGLRTAISSATPVQLDYTNVSGVRLVRVVEPWSIFTQQGSLYVSGFCRAAQAERVFKLDRIAHAELLSQDNFTQPVNASLLSADVPESGRLVSLTISPAGRWLAEEIPHQRLVESDDGTVTIDLDVSHRTWFVGILLAHSNIVQGVAPDGYMEEAHSLAIEALGNYSLLTDTDNGMEVST